LPFDFVVDVSFSTTDAFLLGGGNGMLNLDFTLSRGGGAGGALGTYI
jgi:hypothetical protein